jgi:hypothetical protein
MKKAVILYHGGGELANQLWNYVSIYAYALERGIELENYSFYEYGGFFNIPTKNKLAQLILYRLFKNYRGRKWDFRPRLWRFFYRAYAWCVRKIKKNKILSSQNQDNAPFYLSPTKEADDNLKKLEKNKTIYFDGWLFRNPKGLEKYRTEIKEYFRPQKKVVDSVYSQIKPLRGKYQSVIGVHIRQGDYKKWKNGAYFIEQKRAREIMEEYLLIFKKRKDETCFIITSDGPIDKKHFTGLNVVVSNNNAVADLFLLASTDTVLGSNSTFGTFASYYGNIPLIIMKKEPMDWNYYRDKTGYFENKYATMVHY